MESALREIYAEMESKQLIYFGWQNLSSYLHRSWI